MIRPIKAIMIRNLLKFVRNRLKLFLNIFMSSVFLFIFSFVIKATAHGLENPMNYLISGVIIMTVFQSSLNNSMNILEDISSGVMKEILVAPISRWEIAIGHVLSSAVISVLQGMIIVVIGLFMGLQLYWFSSLEMLGLMLLVGLTFSSLGLFLATITKDSSNFQLLVSIVTFPLTFLSGAYIPTMVLPKFLIPIVYINPLTYATAAFRYVSLKMENLPLDTLVKTGIAIDINGFVVTPILSVLIIAIMCVVFLTLSVNRFKTADFSRIKVFRRMH